MSIPAGSSPASAIRIRTSILLAFALVMPAVAGASLEFQEGIARNPDSNTVLYRERHWLRSDDGRPIERLVLYLCPNGQVFGRKRVDYQRSATAPAFRFDDARVGYVEGLRNGPEPVLFYRASADAPERSAALPSNQLVADAGFDEFIRRHWSTLAAGAAVPLDFALPARLQSFGFSLRRIGTGRVAGEPAWIFRLRLAGILGWIAPHIDVSYGQQSRRLLSFEGLSNIRDDRGDKQTIARIDFPRPPQPVADSQWQSAMSLPVLACAIGR